MICFLHNKNGREAAVPLPAAGRQQRKPSSSWKRFVYSEQRLNSAAHPAARGGFQTQVSRDPIQVFKGPVHLSRRVSRGAKGNFRFGRLVFPQKLRCVRVLFERRIYFYTKTRIFKLQSKIKLFYLRTFKEIKI